MGNVLSAVHIGEEEDGITGHVCNFQDSEPTSPGTYEEESDYGNYISAEENSYCREEEKTSHKNGNITHQDTAVSNPYEDDPLPDTLCKFQNFSLKSCTSSSGSPTKGSSFVDASEMNDSDHLESSKKRKRTLKTLSLSYATDPKYTNDELLMSDGHLPTDETDMKPRIIKCISTNGTEEKYVKCRSFHIVTTASLPWMTGTSINPLLRAVYLNKMNRQFVEEALGDVPASMIYSMMGVVTLVIPWLVEPEDQLFLLGGQQFSTQHDQEQYIRSWIRETAGLPLESDESTGGIRIRFYPSYLDYDLNSIFPTKNIYEELAKTEKIQGDICILDEPEHLGYLHFDAKGMRSNFVHVIGIMHTNYVEYMKQYPQTVLLAPFTYFVNCITTRCYCDRIVKLSDTLQSYAVEKECVSNVHGIRSDFLEVGKKRALLIEKGMDVTHSFISDKSGIYYIGKLLWAKGFDRLIHLESAFKKSTGEYFQIDIFGSGAQEKDIRRAFLGRRSLSTDSLSVSDSIQDRMENLIDTIPRSRYEFRKQALPADFLGRQDHARIGSQYKIFINPSISEVLCTTTAEAIAMGSFVIIPKHPSNDFFSQFPNCLLYKTNENFVSHLRYALKNNPQALSIDHQKILTWEAATERLLEAGMISRREQRRRERVDQAASDEKVIEFTNNSVFDAIRDKVLSKSWIQHEKNKT